MSVASVGAIGVLNPRTGSMSQVSQPDAGANTNAWPKQKNQNGHNNWTKNTKVKTAKCSVCSERIKTYSWDCDKCLNRVCSECCEDTGGSSRMHKYIAQDHLEKKCSCAYPSGQAPYLQREMEAQGIVQPPPWRFAEEEKHRNIKQESKKRKLEQAERNGTPVTPASGKRKKPRSDRTSLTAEPTIASVKPSREGRSIGRYQESDNGIDSTPKSSKPSGKRAITKPSEEGDGSTLEERYERAAADLPCIQMNDGATVIVGGGIIGLCIARELATKALATNTRHSISVIEIRDKHCDLASGSCAGVLSIRDSDERLNLLCDLAQKGWSEYAATPGFTSDTDFVRDNVYSVQRYDGSSQGFSPSWYNEHKNDAFKESEESMGKIDTVKLSQWLHGQCEALGVHFFLEHDVCAITRSADLDVKQVEIKEIDGDGSGLGTQTLDCQNLVLAAGPWTTEIFTDLFKHSTLQLENHVRSIRHIQVQRPEVSVKDNVALIFPDMAADEDDLEDELVIAARQHLKKLIVYAAEAKVEDTGVPPGEALVPSVNNSGPRRHLQRLARKRLNKDGKNMVSDTGGIATAGSSLVSTSANQLPVIDRVPWSGLGRICKANEDQRPAGVWLCFGFGMYGTTLAPGVAKAICRRLFGEASGIDDGYVAIPGYEAKKAGQSVSPAGARALPPKV